MKPIIRLCKVPAAILLAVALISCAGKFSQQSVLDTPEAHYQAGIEFLARGQVAEARHEFEYAIGLDRDFAPGYEGGRLPHPASKQGRNRHRFHPASHTIRLVFLMRTTATFLPLLLANSLCYVARQNQGHRQSHTK